MMEKTSEDIKIDREIDRIREIFIRQDRIKREEEMRVERKRSQSRGDNGIRAIYSKEGSEYSTDIFGGTLQVNQLPVGNLQSMESKIRTKITGNVNVSNLIAYSPKQNNISVISKQETKQEQEETIGSKKLADLSFIEPNEGVTILLEKSKPKKGRSFFDNPNAITRAKILSNTRRNHEKKNPVTSITRNIISENDKFEEKKTEEKKEENALLILNDNEDLFKIEGNYNRFGRIPANALSYRKRKAMSKTLKKDRIIVGKEELQRNQEKIESATASRAATANQGNRLIRMKSTEKKVRERSFIHTGRGQKNRMAPPPLGKTYGHGLFPQVKQHK